MVSCLRTLFLFSVGQLTYCLKLYNRHLLPHHLHLPLAFAGSGGSVAGVKEVDNLDGVVASHHGVLWHVAGADVLHLL